MIKSYPLKDQDNYSIHVLQKMHSAKQKCLKLMLQIINLQDIKLTF